MKKEEIEDMKMSIAINQWIAIIALALAIVTFIIVI